MKNILFNKAKKPCKTIALVLVFTMLINLCSCAADPNKKEADEKSPVDTAAYTEVVYNDAEILAAKLQAGLTELQKLAKDSAKEATDKVAEKAEELTGLLKESQSEMDRFFQENREKVASLGSETLNKRQEAYEKTYHENTNKAKELLVTLSGDASEKAKKKSLKSLNTLLGQEEASIYGTEPINVAEEAEITTTEVDDLEAYEESMQEKSVESDEKDATKDEFLKLSEETELTEDIQAKADELATPLNVYNYLKNTIDYELYSGSRKGAGETFDALAGNDKDQASLLIAMLRYLGYPARYVEGTIELNEKQIKNLTGANSIKRGATVLASAGVPVTTLSSGGKVTAVSLPHTWVEAYVPYTDYRGAGKSAGKSMWIALDTGISQYEEVDSVVSYLDEKGIIEDWNTLLEKGDTDTFIAQIDSVKEQMVAEISKDSTKEFYTKNRMKADTTVSYLPLSLQYKVLTKEETYAKIKDADADRVTFAIGGKKLGTYKYTELSGKRISIEFEPETEEDAKALESYESIFETPAYLMSMKPVLKLDGETVASGNAVILGTKQNFSMKVSSCGMETPISNDITAGSMYQVTLDGQAITSSELEECYDEVVALAESATIENVYSDEYLGKMLDVAGKLYFAQLDIMTTVASEMYDVKTTRSLSEGMTGYQVETSSLYGSPVGVSEGSLVIDIDHDSRGAVSLTGNKEDEVAYMQTNGMISSLCENLIWEELTGAESISTVNVLRNATEQDIELFVINSENYEEMVGKLEASDAVIQDIKTAVGNGKEVTIPAKEVSIDGWTGSGYIIMDPDTGAGAYRISGGLNGGTTSGKVTRYAMLGLILSFVEIVESLRIIIAVLAMTTISGGAFLGFLLALVGLGLAIAQVINLFIDYTDYFFYGDLQAGEKIISDAEWQLKLTLAFAAIHVAARRVLALLDTPAVRKWLGSRLIKKVKKILGVADDADDLPGNGDDDFPIIDDTDPGNKDDFPIIDDMDQGKGTQDGGTTGTGSSSTGGTTGGGSSSTGGTGGTGGTSGNDNLAGSGGSGSGTGTTIKTPEELVKQSTCTNEELYKYLLKNADEDAAKAFLDNGKWPDGVQIPKSSSVLNADGSIDWSKAPQGGYVLDSDGNAIKEAFIPQIGEVIDRYGSSSGRYTSPVVNGKSYAYTQRSLPYVEDLSNYHKYEVIGDFSKIEDYINDCVDVELRTEIDKMVSVYYAGDYSKIAVYKGEAAAIEGWGAGGAVQYEFPFTMKQLQGLKLIRKLE
nr:glycohydrolase toxin TNT-related protein [Eubacterium sp.]